MKILMLSWEFPPKNIGGISEHVKHLSNALARTDNEIHIITSYVDNMPLDEIINNVHVHRVSPLDIDTNDFIKWVMHLNYSMIDRSIKLINELGKFDIIHSHDWLCAYSACVIKSAYEIPMVCTIHATEYGRNGGINTEMQKYISQAEWKLCYEAWKIIVCSNYMKHELKEIFRIPDEKIWVIPNGVDAKAFNIEFEKNIFRRQYAKDDEKIVYFVGRHVYEKGIQVLVDAAPNILKQRYNTKFVIAGTGPMSDELKGRVYNYGLENRFFFTGFIDDETKNKIYAIADIAVFPSLYEPFGIVALEAMAAGCPLVVSSTGGFNEIVENGKNGLKAYTNASDSLAWNINEILGNESLSKTLIKEGLISIEEKFNWVHASNLTTNMYKMVCEEKYELEGGA